MYIREQFYRHSEGIRSIAPKIRVIKNVLVVGLAFALINTMFIPIRTFLTISPVTKASGVWAMVLFYFVGAVSGLYGAVVAQRFTYKNTLIVCLLPYLLLIGAIIYFQFFTIYPVVILLGLIQAPLLCSAVAMLINLAAQFAYFSYKTQEKMVERFLTMYNSLAAFGAMLGSLAAAATFNTIENQTHLSINGSEPLVSRTTLSPFAAMQKPCGRWYCNPLSNQQFPLIFTDSTGGAWLIPFFNQRQMSKILPVYTLTVYAGLVAVAPILLLSLLDRLTVEIYRETSKPKDTKTLMAQLAALLRDKRMQLVIPMLLYTGMADGFFACDVVRAFVQCTSQSSITGYLLFGYGCVSALLHISLGTVLLHISRLTVALAGLLFNIGSLVVMWVWRPVEDDRPVLFVIASSWAMAEAIWRTLTISMVYKCFPESWESAYTVYYMSTFLGTCAGLSMCPYTCMEYKIYMIALWLLASLMPFGLLELRFQQHENTLWVATPE